MPTAEYRVRIADPGATVVDGNVALTLAQADIAAMPILSGPSVDILKGSSTSHPFRLESIVDDVLFVTSGRMAVLGRLAEIQRGLDGGSWTTVGTGRLSHASEVDGRGKVTVEVSDEGWVVRRSMAFRTTDTVQLHPPGLSAAWRDRPAAGLTTYVVVQDDGDYYRIAPNEDDLNVVYQVPQGLRSALVTDLLEPSELSSTAGNFTSLRFEVTSIDYAVVALGYYRGAMGALGDLAPSQSGQGGRLNTAWIYAPGHGYNVDDVITGRFHFATGVEVSDTVPLHAGGVDGVHPMTLFRDVLDGTYGGPATLYESAALDALEALSMPNVYYRGVAPAERQKWLIANIYRPFGVLPLVKKDLTLRPTSLAMPQDLDPDTLEVITASNASLTTWELSAADLLTVLSLKSQAVIATSVVETVDDDRPVDGFDPVERSTEIRHDNTGTLGEIVHEVETALILDAPVGRDAIRFLARELFDVFGDGAQGGEFTVADDLDIDVGDYVVIDHDTQKGFNAGTGDRTGERVALLIEFRDYTPSSVTFRYLDLGPKSAPLAAPSVSIAQDGTDPDLVNVTISSLPAGAQAHVEVAVGASLPSVYPLFRDNVGNEVATFRVDAGAGNAYARARSTAPNRIRSAWATDSVALTARARIESMDVALGAYKAEVSWTVPASGSDGMRTRYSIHQRGTEPTLGSQTDYASSDGGFTITGLGPRDMVTVELVPYPTWTGSAVSGTPGEAITRQAIFPRVVSSVPTRNRSFVVTGIEVSIDSNGEAVVSGTGDEDVANLYVTVGDGTDPADPTSASNDGVIVGRTGSVSTGVKITTGNEAHVKVRGVDGSGNPGAVTSAKFARNLGPFHKVTTTRSVTLTTTETTLETITIPAGSLGTDGVVEILCAFDFTNNTDRAYLRAYLASDLVVDTEWLVVSVDAARLEMTVFAKGSTGAQGTSWAIRPSPTGGGSALDDSSHTEDSTADIDITITGQLDDEFGDTLSLLLSLAKFVGTL